MFVSIDIPILGSVGVWLEENICCVTPGLMWRTFQSRVLRGLLKYHGVRV